MVTKRARRWVRRGVTVAIVLLVLGSAAATWFTSEAIEADLLFVTGGASITDPGDADLAFTQVDIPGPLGNYPAWLVAADDDSNQATWAIFVHDKDAGLGQALDLLPTFVEHGLPSLVISYRDDAGAPPSEGGHHTLGTHEWEDLEAAVGFAIDSGAGDVVLVGHGSGGSIALVFMRQSVLAEQVSGVVLDSAYLDPGSMVDTRTAANNVPGFLAGWGRALAAFRFGVDWAILDQVAAAGEFSTPILLIHGDGDEWVPVWIADTFADAQPFFVEYLRIEGAGHLEGFATDPDRYAATVDRFLRRVAPGPIEQVEVVAHPERE